MGQAKNAKNSGLLQSKKEQMVLSQEEILKDSHSGGFVLDIAKVKSMQDYQREGFGRE